MRANKRLPVNGPILQPRYSANKINTVSSRELRTPSNLEICNAPNSVIDVKKRLENSWSRVTFENPTYIQLLKYLKHIYEIRNFTTAFTNELQVHMWKQTKPWNDCLGQLDATIMIYWQTNNSTCFAHHCGHLQECKAVHYCIWFSALENHIQ